MLTSLASAKAGRPVRRPTRYEKLARPVRAATRPIMDLSELRTERFFQDKNRAFWILQATGWGASFVVRALGGLADAMGLVFFVPTLISTTTGFSLPLFMASTDEPTTEIQPLMRSSNAVLCYTKQN